MVIALPNYDEDVVSRVDPKSVLLGAKVEQEIRDYVAAIASGAPSCERRRTHFRLDFRPLTSHSFCTLMQVTVRTLSTILNTHRMSFFLQTS
jgi:hypothetical protein